MGADFLAGLAMREWRFCWAFVAACWLLLLVGGFVRGQEGAAKKRVAVLNFDGPEEGVGLAGDVGKGVSVQLIQKLVEGGKFAVVDRSAVEKMLEEQTEANSGSMGGAKDAYGLAAKTGRMLGLDAMIIGAVTRYGADDKGKAGGGGALRGGVGMRTRQSKAIVEITARVFNVSTGEVLTEFKSAGESEKSGTVTMFSVRGQPESTFETLGDEFTGSLLAAATRNAVEQLATQLNSFADRIPALGLSAEGFVAEVNGKSVTLNVGKKAGVKVGDRFEVMRSGLAERVGVATVTEVAEEYCVAEFSGIDVGARVGDRVRGASKVSDAKP